jgi:hypothetical protein
MKIETVAWAVVWAASTLAMALVLSGVWEPHPRITAGVAFTAFAFSAGARFKLVSGSER